VSALIAAFRASARRWEVPETPVVVVTLAAWLAVPLLAALFFLNRQVFRAILDEDRIVEWGQVLFFVATAVAGAMIARNRFRMRYRGQALVWILFTVAMLVIAGEEIAWGQRLLGLETPEFLEDINRQEEITFHNIGRTLTVFNVALFAGSLYAIAAEWIEQRWHLAGRFADGDRLYVPPLFLAGLFGVMVAYRFVRWVLLPQESYALTSLSEWAELCFAGALFVTVALSARWVLRHRAAPAAH
jgi:hypothetical protein